MKTRLILTAVAMVALGLMVGHSNAATIEFVVELAPGETGQVTLADQTVAFNVYAVILAADGDLTNDNLLQTYGGLSTPGALLGNVSFTLASNMVNGLGLSGTVQDRDADTDLDVGGLVHNTQTAANSWIYAFGGTSGQEGQRLLLGSGEFTLTDPTPVIGQATDLLWTIRNKTDGLGGAKLIHKYTVDGVLKEVNGASTELSVGAAPVITFVPEPVTMVLLAAGGVGLLVSRRRKAA